MVLNAHDHCQTLYENMKKYLVCYLLVAAVSFGFLTAQTLNPPPEGEYRLTKKLVDKSTLPPSPYRVKTAIYKSEADLLEMGVDWQDKGSRYMSKYNYERLKDNVFAQTSDGYFITPIEDFLVMRPDNVIDIYNLSESQDEIIEIMAMGPPQSKWKTLKDEAEANAESFSLSEWVAMVPAWNQAKKDKIEAEREAAEAEKARIAAEKKAAAEKAAAEREAAAKAKAEAEAAERATADLCAPLKKYMGMASSNFASIKGNLDPEETEMEEEDVFFTTETPPLFVTGRLMPNLFDPNKKELMLDSKMFYQKSDAQAELEFIKSKLTCFSSKTGYKVYEDSGLHFYEKGSLKFYLFTQQDMDTDKYMVRLKMKK